VAAVAFLYDRLGGAGAFGAHGGGGKVTVGGVSAGQNDFEVLIITDLDQRSKEADGKKYMSVVREGLLTRDPETNKYAVTWGRERQLHSGHNEAGRGMELSELVNFHGHLMTLDDRTGILFEIVRGDGEEDEDGEWRMAPRHIFAEGDGSVDKGMKFEWATVRNGELVMGSFGKEYTNSEGAIISTNNNWVIFMDEHGSIRREDWTERYNKIRAALGASFPGYVIHESGSWSEPLNKWVFLPRRVSPDPYDDEKDELMGSNKIILADPAFVNVEVRDVGIVTPERGFSTFKFVPGTGDEVVFALKSAEFSKTGAQTSFATVFTIDGQVLMDETEIPGGYKYEGLEIFL
ncbi:unnamed protein product, partial [Phaeothamnion confervicola]